MFHVMLLGMATLACYVPAARARGSTRRKRCNRNNPVADGPVIRKYLVRPEMREFGGRRQRVESSRVTDSAGIEPPGAETRFGRLPRCLR